VPIVILNGTVTGDVRSEEHIELAAKARVDGDVYYKLIEMSMGAAVNGSLVHRSEADASVLAFDREAVESGTLPE
jgi:cytoskeletal protein CcmA (bactofilin family)